jgi:hypothetical protein
MLRDVVPRRVFRTIEAAEPVLRDFMSNKAKGMPPRGVEITHPRYHEDVSVWENLELCRAKALKYRQGSHIAELEVPDDGSVTCEKTFSKGHYSLWAAPEILFGLVRQIYTVEEG